ncbi:MAG: CocE/NonD family hydrolase, partial [Actinomycetota bacterium]|nr:CocE/NonD family hydrolase [Actinomycetota bacterium]
MRKLVAVLSAVVGSLALAPSADAAIADVFASDVACTVAADGVRQCGQTSPAVPPRSTTDETFDGVPLDVNVAFPPDPGGADGPYPLIVWGHGYGGAKIGFGASGSTTSGMRRFTSRGYAVMSITTRGFRESCGSLAAQVAGGLPCTAEGYVRLMDTRYEVRDYQDLAGVLADEGLVTPDRIGALGGSYGGGLSMALGALKDRQMLPDGTLVDWESPGAGTPMQLAAATPNIPWSDLAYSLVPNGRTLDYLVDNDYGSRVGVMKQSLVNGLYLSGLLAPGFYSVVGTDPEADLTAWLGRLTVGEPYDSDPTATSIIDEIKAHHSSYYIDSSPAPAPMLMSSGFTDDLFPADETIRFYNRTKVAHPGTPTSLFFGDFGHQRSANKADVSAALVARENAWLDFYVKGTGAAPALGVTTYTQTCPDSSSTPSGGPFSATNWATIAPGELRLNDAQAKTIGAIGGDASIAERFDPVQAGGQACRTNAAVEETGTASYSLPAVKAPTTLMGATTVIAEINSQAPNNAIAARLFDVLPDGTERLVARGLWRPATGSSRQAFQLHPNGYQFAAGSVPRVQLLPKDSAGGALNSYGRAANGQGPITISNVEVRLPVIERPGAAAGQVKVPRDEFVPPGRVLSPDFAALANDANATIAEGKLKGNAKMLKVRLGSPATWVACHATVQLFSSG